jgi:hypothetical protein
MTALAVEPNLFDLRDGEPTLDDLIVGAWEGLTAHRVMACPVCDGELAPQYAAHPRPVSGRCRSCGTVLERRAGYARSAG